MNKDVQIAEMLVATKLAPDFQAGREAVQQMMVENYPAINFDEWNSRHCDYEPAACDVRGMDTIVAVVALIKKMS